MLKRYLMTIAMISGLLMSCGCGQGKPKLILVSGVVTLNGEPLEEGNINFSIPKAGLGAMAQLEEGGKFRVEGGMRAGEYNVTFTPPSPTPDNPKPIPSKIPEKYRSIRKSGGLVVEISPSEHDLSFELEP